MDPRESGKRISHGPLVRVGLARRASRKNRPSSASRQLPVNRCFIPLINCGDKNYIALSSPRGNGLMHPSILFPSSNIPNIYVYIYFFFLPFQLQLPVFNEIINSSTRRDIMYLEYFIDRNTILLFRFVKRDTF